MRIKFLSKTLTGRDQLGDAWKDGIKMDLKEIVGFEGVDWI
jgi:hypothetical protein